jgi:hypothetical protein
MAFRSRAFRLGLLAAMLAMSVALTARAAYAPKFRWTPGGPVNYGDPDPGNGGVDILRMSRHLFMFSLQRLSNPAALLFEPLAVPTGQRTR